MPRVEQVQQKALEEFRQKNINSSKKKKNYNKSASVNDTIVMFICLFFLLSLVFIQVVKGLTPKIDTSVGNNTSDEVVEEVRDPKMKVDDRLKLIQFNDKMVSGDILKERENSIFNTSLDEPVVLPRHQREQQEREKVSSKQNQQEQTIEEKVSNIISKNLDREQKEEENTERVAPRPIAPVPASYKVYVGLYQTAEQAQTAKSIIKESTLGQNAFVKLTKEGYTLQIGSYSAKPQAEAMVQALRVNNFPLARMAEEK